MDLSTEEAAALMGVHARSVLRWAKAGLLPAWQTGGGRWRIRPAELRRFMAERGMRPPAQLAPEPGRIAVVDDDRAYVAAVVETLAELAPAAQTRCAHDGLSAGLLLATFRPHLLLLDSKMPGVDGFGVLERLRVHPELDGTSVVIVSGKLTPVVRARFLALGAARCLAKPIDEQDLIRAVADFVPSGTRASGQLARELDAGASSAGTP